MNRIYGIILIVLIDIQYVHGMHLEHPRTPDALTEIVKKMKFTGQDEEHSKQTSAQSSAMEITAAQQDENDSPLAICFTDEDMEEIGARLEEVRLAQIEAEGKMTPKEHDEYYRLALIRAIGDGSTSSRDEDDRNSAQDKDW